MAAIRGKHWLSICALALACLTTAPIVSRADPANLPQIAVIPRPLKVEAGAAAAVVLRAGTPIIVAPGDQNALDTARWLAALALRSRGLRLIPKIAASAPSRTAAIVIERRSEPLGEEGYVLDAGAGRIAIQAPFDAGLLYGAVTLWQLMTADGGRGPVAVASLHIEDRPRFAWRGLLLDSARHFQSPAFIEQMIDWMALHKLNVLQWHLTDDQGWRLQIRRYPLLTDVGAWRLPASAEPATLDRTRERPRLYGGFYSQDQVRAIVAYAQARNVAIVPEIEMPGHAVAALLAYPELSAGPPPPRSVQSDWGIFPYAYGADDQVFNFIDNVLVEVMDLFPSRYIHIGGDEVPLEIWKTSPRVQARMKALGITSEAALQNYFIQRVGNFLAQHGRTLVGFDEILQGGPLPAQAVVTSWHGAESALAAARAGHDVVLAIAPALYFDHRQSDLASEPPGRGQVVSLHEVYAFDPDHPPLEPPKPPPPAVVATASIPAPVSPPSGPASPPAAPAILGPVDASRAPAAQAGGITGSAATAAAEAQTPPPPGPPVFEAADRAHILGLQGNIWTEHIRTQERVETMAFPRAAAVAEAAWSSPANRDWDDFLTRLPAEFDRFAGVGLTEDESLFAVELKADPDSDRNVSVALANPPQPEHSHLAVAAPPLVPSPIGGAPILTPPPIPIVAAPDPPPDHPLLGQIHYALGARTPLASAPAYQAPIRVALPATLSAATFVGGRRISPTLDRRLDALSVRRRVSQELILCTDKLTLNLEGDPQPQGDRSVFLVDIMNPCWIWPAAPLTDIGAVSVGVGALPFNFQIGVDLKKIILRPPSTPQGELQVHLDGCAGALIASLPLAPASVRPGVTTLTADLPPLQGPHALCFEFTARRVDPLWAVAWVQLVPRAAPAKAP